MKIVFLLPLLFLAACESEPVVTAPDNANSNYTPPSTGGPCGDGSVLKPGEHCK